MVSSNSWVHVTDLRSDRCRRRKESDGRDRAREHSCYKNRPRWNLFTMTETLVYREVPKSPATHSRLLRAFTFHNLGLLDAHQTGSQFPDRSNDLHWFLFGSCTSTGPFSFLPLGMHARRDASGSKRYRDTESVRRTALRRTDAAYRASSARYRPPEGFDRPCARDRLGRARQRLPGG
jgi:hypothetical protein